MILSYQIFQQFTDLEGFSPETVADCLNQLGIETTISHNYQKLSSQLVVAKVISKERHPQLQKLWICKADIKNQQLTIVCGADNFVVGNKVILAPIGTKLNANLTIKKRKFGNYLSEGMFCSWQELNINKKDEGIAILPAKAELGNNNPLQYIGYDDCLFKAETPWQEKELSSHFVLAQYLTKMLRKDSMIHICRPVKQDFYCRLNTQNTSKKAKFSETNQTEGFQVKTLLRWKQDPTTPVTITSALEKLQIQIKNNFWVNLAEQINWEVGFDLQKIGLDIKKRIFDKEHDYWRWEINLLYDQKKQSEVRLPYSLAVCAYKRFLWWVEKLILQLEIEEKSSFYSKLQQITISCQYLNQILGTQMPVSSIVELFRKSIFDVTEKAIDQTTTTWFQYHTPQTDQLNIIVPDYRSLTKVDQIISEAVRLLGCDQIKLQPLNNQTIEWKEDFNLTLTKKIKSYLLHLGFSENKNDVFIENQQPSLKKVNSQQIAIVQKDKNCYLQDSLITNLTKNNPKNTNSFSIDKAFHQQEGLPIENTHLGVIMSKQWLNNSVEQEKINFNHSVLVQIINNICQILRLPSQHLQKKQDSKDKTRKEIVKNQEIDPLFLNQGYEEIFYKNKYIGKIGIINEKKRKNIYFYLELNLTTLKLIQGSHQRPLQIREEKKKKEVYVDLSLQFNPEFKSKIYCLIDEKKIIECDHYQHLIQYTHSLDKLITKVELIDQYKKQTLTFRVWKEQLKKEVNSKRELFAKVEVGLKQLRNVKIV